MAVCISSPVRSRKPVLMKATRLLAAAMQAFRLTDGAALFVHDAQLDGAVLQTQHLFDAAEQLGGKAYFGRAVHLGLDDVDRALARIADGVFLGAPGRAWRWWW
jgi:hypothetical protein